MNIETKILNAIKANRLNPSILGERKWYNYFIAVNELVWSRNLKEGYEIHVYDDNSKSEHLATIVI
ncbi:hypothetical protein E0I26_06200 [Flavobacterium rhamnosiphilum]|uniref:Uncharacterized protein n=1 Tax=Flavobacterium rhamnosiphilum TaxID=2541724 RepID=A0A4R5FA11_9FLAO|nr:hypothetical protein [Flavobacterium rhamnosiphilum]TDE45536.1 hypothetical protein E0I26_06200 [Flavobacterium rhamnosiphilum]